MTAYKVEQHDLQVRSMLIIYFASTIGSFLHRCLGLAPWRMCKCCVTYLLTYSSKLWQKYLFQSFSWCYLVDLEFCWIGLQASLFNQSLKLMGTGNVSRICGIINFGLMKTKIWIVRLFFNRPRTFELCLPLKYGITSHLTPVRDLDLGQVQQIGYFLVILRPWRIQVNRHHVTYPNIANKFTEWNHAFDDLNGD